MIDDRRLPKLLNDVANFYVTDADVKKIVKKWPDLVIDLKAMPQDVADKMSLHDDLARSNALQLAEIAKRINALHIVIQRAWVKAPAPNALQDVHDMLFPDGQCRVALDWRRQALTYQPQTTVEQALYYLLQHSSLALICGNLECTHPFFMAKRPNERYCTNACFDNAQRLATARWWSKHGKEWLKNRSKERKVKSRKSTGGGR